MWKYSVNLVSLHLPFPRLSVITLSAVDSFERSSIRLFCCFFFLFSHKWKQSFASFDFSHSSKTKRKWIAWNETHVIQIVHHRSRSQCVSYGGCQSSEEDRKNSTTKIVCASHRTHNRPPQKYYFAAFVVFVQQTKLNWNKPIIHYPMWAHGAKVRTRQLM